MPEYRAGAPVAVTRRTRGIRIDLDDGGRAVALAGRPAGWMQAAERAVEVEGMNVNRRGVVFVQGFAGRDRDRLERKVAAASLAVYDALLELHGAARI